MFLRATNLSEKQWVLHWKMANPAGTLKEAVRAAEQEFPGRATQSYAGACHPRGM